MKIYFSIGIENGIRRDYNEFKQFVINVLKHPYGWKRFYPDLEFIEVKSGNSMTKTHPLILKIILTKSETVKRECDFINLSCYDPTKLKSTNIHYIYINLNNWTNPKIGATNAQLSLTEYRQYIVQHEFGHAIGKGHLNPRYYTGQPCPIMAQQTKGIFSSIPNIFPTEADFQLA